MAVFTIRLKNKPAPYSYITLYVVLKVSYRFAGTYNRMKSRIIFSLFFLHFLPLLLPAQQLPELIPYRKGKLWGFADSTGKIRIEPQWDGVEFFDGQAAIVHKDKRSGVITREGNMIVPAVYLDIFQTRSGRFIVDSLQWSGLRDSNGNSILPAVYAQVLEVPGTRTEVFVLTDSSRHFNLLYNFSTKRIVYKTINNLQSWFEGSNLLFEEEYTPPQQYRYRLVDINGTVKTNRFFDKIYVLQPKLISIDFSKEFDFDQWLIGVEFFANGKKHCGIYNQEGNEILPPVYAVVDYWDTGLLAVTDTLWNELPLMDIKGNPIIPGSVCREQDRSNYFRVVQSTGARRKKYAIGLYDRSTEKYVLPAQYESCNWISDPHHRMYLFTEKNGEMQFCDSTGRLLFRPKMEVMEFLGDSLLLARNEKKNIVYRLDGSILFETSFRDISLAGKHNFLARKGNGKYQNLLLDSTGKPILKADDIHSSKHVGKYLYVVQNDKKGLADTNGKMVIPCIYRSIYSRESLFFLIDEHNKTALYDDQLKQITGFIYDRIEPISTLSKLLAVKSGDSTAVITVSGKLLTPWKAYTIFAGSTLDSLLFAVGVPALDDKSDITWDVFDTTGKSWPALAASWRAALSEATYYQFSETDRYGGIQLLTPLKSIPLTTAGYDSFTAKGFQRIVPEYKQKQYLSPCGEKYVPAFKGAEPVSFFRLYKSVYSDQFAWLGNSRGEVLLDSTYDPQFVYGNYFLTTKNKKVNVFDAAQKRFLSEPAKYSLIYPLRPAASPGAALFCGQTDKTHFELFNGNGNVITTTPNYIGIYKNSSRLFPVCASYGNISGYIDDTGRQYWED